MVKSNSVSALEPQHLWVLTPLITLGIKLPSILLPRNLNLISTERKNLQHFPLKVKKKIANQNYCFTQNSLKLPSLLLPRTF